MINTSRVSNIARKIIADSGENIFNDYFIFYSDSKWLIEIIRQIKNTVNIMLMKKDNYISQISHLDEDLSYIEELKLDEMNTVQASKEMKKYIDNIKKKYEDIDKSEDGLQKYYKSIDELKIFLNAYESSCINVFKNKYHEDEYNVSNLLDTMNEAGNYILNKK